MELGHFYFFTDKYYIDFPDVLLMKNHETVNGVPHDRPCFYAFQDNKTGLYWMIPISSQVAKYEKLYNDKVAKYGKCDTLAFGNVLGHRSAFLIQNMCPTTTEYIRNEYIDSKSKTPVKIDGIFESELLGKAKRVLALHKNGTKLIFPDVIKIEKKLLSKQEN